MTRRFALIAVGTCMVLGALAAPVATTAPAAAATPDPELMNRMVVFELFVAPPAATGGG